ncbi:MAG: STAS domain-containing protein [Opitutae bacterium]|nr:STAS domain-containing protein [Opitutae bacterium]MCD8298306.1 STAS domain-containing protein [Opitutae bacterium]
MSDQAQYLVAATGDAVLVLIRGRATYTTCREFDEFLGKIGASETCKKLIIDMRDCSGIDSTVLGLIAGAAGDFSAKNGEIIMQKCNPRISEVVENLGLPALLTFLAGDSVAEGTEKLLASETTEHAASAASNSTILRAHEKLMETSPENAARFKQVVDFMRADLGK